MTVQVGGDRTHVSLWAPDAGVQKAAKLFTVTAGRQIRAGTLRLHHGAEAVLRPEARLHVTVNGATGADIMFDAFTPAGNGVDTGTDMFESIHDNTLTNLPGGPVKLRLTFGETGQVIWYGGATLEEATTITLTPGRTSEVTVNLS